MVKKRCDEIIFLLLTGMSENTSEFAINDTENVIYGKSTSQGNYICSAMVRNSSTLRRVLASPSLL